MYIYLIYIYICIYITIHKYIYIYMISHHHIHLLSIFSHGIARSQTLRAFCRRIRWNRRSNGSSRPNKRVPKKRVQKAQETAGNQWKPWIYSMDMETSWFFFHDFSIVGRWTSAAASSELWHANPATQSLKQKHTSWKTHTHIYIHRCIYIYISVPNISISISGKTSTFFSWQRRPPTWTTSWRSCWIHGFRRRRACWMIGTLKKWWGNNGFISWLIDLNRCQ